jgi:uncharacterized protein (DUF1810 family)
MKIPDSTDVYDLQRFVDAQDPVYEEVRSELREGRKRGHWMWFVFPQLKGLGSSYMSERFGISSLREARAYMKHPSLGPRLRECISLLGRAEGRPIEEILGHIDSVKLRSCLTLFARATTDDNEIFQHALEKFFEGEPDPLTLARLRSLPGS